MKILVTGATGFAGSYLMERLLEQGMDVVGTSAKVANDPNLISLNLLGYTGVKQALKEIKPAMIYHLAAFSSPGLSFQSPVKAINETLEIQINLYEACLDLGLRPRFLVISSGQIYGKTTTPADLPFTEESEVDFNSPYDVAKFAQENLANLYAKRDIESIIARPFNHLGPRQQLGFLLPDLAKQIAELEQSPDAAATLKVGNLSSKRDFTDVRDIVRAYQLLAEKGEPGEVYNICTGQAVAGQQILEMLLALARKPIKVEPDPTRMRPSDMPELYGDSAKLRQATGWQPQIALTQTISETLEYWRSQLS